MIALDDVLNGLVKRVTEAIEQDDLDYAVLHLARFYEILWRAFRVSFADHYISKNIKKVGYKPGKYRTLDPADSHSLIKQHSELLKVPCYITFDAIYQARCDIIHAKEKENPLKPHQILTYSEETKVFTKQLSDKFRAIQQLSEDDPLPFDEQIVREAKRFTIDKKVLSKLRQLWTLLVKYGKKIEIVNFTAQLKEVFPQLDEHFVQKDFDESHLYHFVYEAVVLSLEDLATSAEVTSLEANRVIRGDLERCRTMLRELHEREELCEVNFLDEYDQLNSIANQFKSSECLESKTVHVKYRETDVGLLIDEIETSPVDLYTLGYEPQFTLGERVSLNQLYEELSFIDDLLDETEGEWVILFIEDSLYQTDHRWLERGGYSSGGHTFHRFIQHSKILMTAGALTGSVYRHCLPSALEISDDSVSIAEEAADLNGLRDTSKVFLASGEDRIGLEKIKNLHKYPILISCSDEYTQNDRWCNILSILKRGGVLEIPNLLKQIKSHAMNDKEFRENVSVHLNPKWLKKFSVKRRPVRRRERA